MAKPILAIMYDFDKTLSVTDMQNYSFIPNLNMTPDEFWSSTSQFSKKEGVERILSYMYKMIEIAKKKGIKVTREYLKECGKNIKLFPGLTTWFKRINEYGAEHDVVIEHYLVSSGTKEIVEGSSIYPEFTKVYGCEYYYNDEGEPIWPKLAINYTQKTQFYFRIAKGAFNATDDISVNEKSEILRVPYKNIVYLGDGMTDIACMTLVKKNGGHSIAVYPDKDSGDKVRQIYEDNRCNFMAKADYSSGGDIDTVIKLLIDRVALESAIEKREKSLANKNKISEDQIK